MNGNSYADLNRQWQQLLAGLDVAGADLQQFEAEREELRTILAETIAINNRQEMSRTRFHLDTRALQDHNKRGKELATRLRNGARARYGNKSELLRQFGIQPLRPRPRPLLTPPEAAAQAARRAGAAARVADRAAVRAAQASDDALLDASAEAAPPKP
jgi:hypothetical protein